MWHSFTEASYLGSKLSAQDMVLLRNFMHSKMEDNCKVHFWSQFALFFLISCLKRIRSTRRQRLNTKRTNNVSKTQFKVENVRSCWHHFPPEAHWMNIISQHTNELHSYISFALLLFPEILPCWYWNTVQILLMKKHHIDTALLFCAVEQQHQCWNTTFSKWKCRTDSCGKSGWVLFCDVGTLVLLLPSVPVSEEYCSVCHFDAGILFSSSAPMATSAQEQMKEYWVKNQKLKRPNSPWIIYQWVSLLNGEYREHSVCFLGRARRSWDGLMESCTYRRWHEGPPTPPYTLPDLMLFGDGMMWSRDGGGALCVYA